MPFEISPSFVSSNITVVATKGANEAHHPWALYAEAMLRGCKTTKQAFGEMYKRGFPIPMFWFDTEPKACALGAMNIGLGRHPLANCTDTNYLRHAYSNRYGTDIICDNDLYCMTREQIAARIAAL